MPWRLHVAATFPWRRSSTDSAEERGHEECASDSEPIGIDHLVGFEEVGEYLDPIFS